MNRKLYTVGEMLATIITFLVIYVLMTIFQDYQVSQYKKEIQFYRDKITNMQAVSEAQSQNQWLYDICAKCSNNKEVPEAFLSDCLACEIKKHQKERTNK